MPFCGEGTAEDGDPGISLSPNSVCGVRDCVPDARVGSITVKSGVSGRPRLAVLLSPSD